MDKANLIPLQDLGSYHLPTGTVEMTTSAIVTTVHGGASAKAVPTYKQEDHDRARSLGYDTPWEMHRDHDLTHCLLAYWLGLAEPPVIAGVARGEPLTKAGSGAEEEAVLAIQKFAQQQGVDLRKLALDAPKR